MCACQTLPISIVRHSIERVGVILVELGAELAFCLDILFRYNNWYVNVIFAISWIFMLLLFKTLCSMEKVVCFDFDTPLLYSAVVFHRRKI